MGILQAYDLTGSHRAAAELAGCDHHTVARYVALREAGQSSIEREHRALTDLVPTAKAQRWDPAEVVRVLLAEEAAGRDATNLRPRRKRAGFPAGKTFGDWDEAASSIPRPTHGALKTLEWVKNKESRCICGPSVPAKATSVKRSPRPVSRWPGSPSKTSAH